jgi:hypothetical protein
VRSAHQSRCKMTTDDNNGVISLGCWTSLSESNEETNLLFLVNGYEVSIKATQLRWILFMGYLPHKTRPVNKEKPATDPRLHHSLFVKPEAEYLSAHILSNLPCAQHIGDWLIDLINNESEMRNDFVISPIVKNYYLKLITSSKSTSSSQLLYFFYIVRDRQLSHCTIVCTVFCI